MPKINMGEDFKSPVVTVIGTCRVHHTLRAIEKKGLIQLNNGGLGTFVHSTPEILFRLKVLLGMETYQEDLIKLQAGELEETKLKSDEEFDFTNTDILVIELSSIKAMSFQNNPLQLNEVKRHMCTPYGDFGKILRANIRSTFNGRKEFIDLPDIEIPKSFPPDYLEIINKLKLNILSEQQIFSDLNQISSLVKIPILLVNHINLPKEGGELIISRNKLCEMVNKFSKLENIPVFNPVEMFKKYKREELLMKEGKDLNHYAKNKLLVVGNEQLFHINSVISDL